MFKYLKWFLVIYLRTGSGDYCAFHIIITYILPGVLSVNSDNLLHIHYSYSHRCYICLSSRILILIFYKNQEPVYFTPGNWNPRIFSFQQRVRTSSVQANLVSWSGRVDRKVVHMCSTYSPPIPHKSQGTF